MRFPRPAFVPALAVALAVALMLLRPPSQSSGRGRMIDTRGWTLTQFVEHLRQRGVHLHVVPGMSDGNPGNDVYLTEDPHATWVSLQYKMRVIERIHEWRGTVHVTYFDAERKDPLPELDRYSCRIGRFVLFGDETILRRIRDAFRK